jgi:pimeloyl-ACP methyl ester carboxylesterase
VLDIGELADALAGCLDACGIERAAIIGHSMGCQTVAEFVRRYPERARAVALIGPSVDRHARSALTQTWRLAIDGTRTPPSSVLILMRDFAECGVRRTLVTLGHALRDRPEDKLPGFPMPTLIVRGNRDPLAPQRWVEELADAAPRGRLVNVPGASHAVHYEQPELTAQLVEELIAEATAGARAEPAAA